MKKPTPLRDLIPQDSRYPYAIETRRASRAEFIAAWLTILGVFVLALLALLDFWG
jgi:uncharacterized membrane protein